MTGVIAAARAELKTRPGRNTFQAFAARWCFIGVSLAFLAALLFAPLIAVFGTAMSAGAHAYFDSFADPDTRAAIRLTLLTAAIVVPLNTLFGVAAAWAIAKFEFKGKSMLITLIDLPIAVSPVIAGLIYVLVYGVNGWFGLWLTDRDWNVVFATPGVVLATLFVTFPYVARELIPLMQQLGNDEEEAAISLGAGGFMTFWRVTLPKIRWGVLYGVILCNARAMGEFGAVTVVSGRIRGLTTTMPLQIEMLYEDHKAVAAFALASLLTLLAVATLVIKTVIEWRGYRGK